MNAELSVIIVMKPFDSSFLNRSVHPLDLSIGPWMLDPGEGDIQCTFSTSLIKDVLRSVAISDMIRELDALICQHYMYAVGHSLIQIAQDLRGYHLTGFGI